MRKETTINVPPLLLRAARLPWAGPLVRFCFTHMSTILPFERLRETATLIVFRHPHPAYPLHILIVPRRAITSLLDLGPGDADFLADLVVVTQSLVRELGLEKRGYRLVANGGPNQDFPQLHFHLVSGA